MAVEVSGLILAGGKGERFGGDKAALVLFGRPLIQRQVELLRRLGLEELVVAIGWRRPLPLPEGVVVVEDHYPGRGPLAGLHAGLLAANNPACLVVACDMPFLVPALAQELLNLEEGQVKVCVRKGFIEPFPGLYTKALLPALEARLVRGELGVQDFIRSVPHRLVPEERVLLLDPCGYSFVNLNRAGCAQLA